MKNIDFTPEIVEATEKVRNTAVDLAPVYPHKAKRPYKKNYTGGNLRTSIKSRVYNRGKNDVVGVVFTPVEYAIYQEFGTRYQSGTPFMRPALNINRAGITQSMKKFLKDKLREAVK